MSNRDNVATAVAVPPGVETFVAIREPDWERRAGGFQLALPGMPDLPLMQRMAADLADEGRTPVLVFGLIPLARHFLTTERGVTDLTEPVA